MKKIISTLVVTVMIFALPFTASAQTRLDKLGRGISNTLTGLLALPYTMKKESDEKGVLAGITTGMVKGVVNVVIREFVGVYEIVTFPFPFSSEFEPILDDPEYFIK
jgi:putative exosortase-associated protein (TIGR04073 family)